MGKPSAYRWGLSFFLTLQNLARGFDMPRKRSRANGSGTLFRRKAGGPWIARWHDHTNTRRQRSTGTSDKATAERILRKIISDEALRREGVIDVADDRYAAHERRPLSVHLADWQAALTAKGVTPQQVKQATMRATKIVDATKADRLSALSASRVQAAIGDLHDDADGNGLSLQTCHHYLRAIKQFSRWLHRDGRIKADPLAHLSGFNAETDRRYERRALTADELTVLIESTETAPTWRKLTGPDRAMLYRVAAGTGFRAKELRSLAPADFHLNEQPPVVVLQAKQSKRRRKDVQPIRSDLAELLKRWLANIPAGRSVWNSQWHDKAAEGMRCDLRLARARWIKNTNVPAERRQRHASDFLAITDHSGRVADFHSLRATYITLVIQGGASVKQAQALARHSDPKLTFNRYAPLRVSDIASGLEGMPVAVTSKSLGCQQRVSDSRDMAAAVGAENGLFKGEIATNTVFKTVALNHSATSPNRCEITHLARPQRAGRARSQSMKVTAIVRGLQARVLDSFDIDHSERHHLRRAFHFSHRRDAHAAPKRLPCRSAAKTLTSVEP